MNTPPKGHYRNLLPSHLSHIRLALTNQPMTGVKKIPQAQQDDLITFFDDHPDQYAKHYANGLRTGSMVAIVENSAPDTYWRPGELFLKS